MKYTLFIDELGESSPKRYRQSPFFILSGCSINQEKRDRISRSLDNIKFKYWDSTNIIFRSYSIGRKEKDFAVFRNNPSKFREFIKNLNFFFSSCPLVLLGVVVDQKKAFEKNWAQKTVLKRAYNGLFANFIRLLSAQNASGEIVQEASTPLQDITIYEIFFNYQSQGLPNENIFDDEVKKRLSSLSFVTKKHMDAESQLADLLSHGLKLEYKIRHKSITLASLNSYEKMIRKWARGKLYEIPKSICSKKKLKYQNFRSLVILP
jgi:hypothetical protein